jgi:hypothetical protein
LRDFPVLWRFAENRNAGVKIKTAMMQVEAVLQMLQPNFDVRSISAKRRNKSNPWFKRGTLFRSAVDVLRRATAPMTAREIAEALIAGKAKQATRKQAYRRPSWWRCGSATAARWLAKARPRGGD